MKVKLLAYTPDPEKVVAAAAKLCYSKADIDTIMDGLTDEKVTKFLSTLVERGHMSPFEHASFTFGIEDVSRSFLAQMSRHRIASFCVSGDTVVGYNERNRRMTIRELYEKTPQYQHMTKLRSVDESSKEIVNNHLLSVWQSGIKETYCLTTLDGYQIRATAEHKFLTTKGWKRLGDLQIGDTLYTNGVDAYQSPEWLNYHYNILGESQSEIADLCGVSKHTIRKWVSKFHLQKPMGSWSIGKEPHNKGKTKDSYEPMRRTSEKMTGNHNAQYREYKINEDPETISGGYFVTHRKNPKCGVCEVCGEVGYTELHHKDRNPKNWLPDNVEELCMICHKRRHLHDRIKAVKPSVIASIEFYGEEMTYDIEMQAPYHNFVADGFIVHNSVQSQRYVHDNFGAVVPEAIKENAGCNDIYKQTIEALYNIYDGLTETLQNQYISDGMDAKAAEKKATEDARYILPNAACTKMIVTMNARELMHFFNLRCCFRAQQEIRAVADEMLRQVKEVAPTIFKNAGAPCVSGPCPEGKFSCGHPRGGSNDQ